MHRPILKSLSFLLIIISFAAIIWAQESPDSLTAALNEARALINEGKAQAAIARLQPASRENDPQKAARVSHMLGVAYFHANNPAEAINHLAPLVDRFKDDSSTRREIIQLLGLAHYLTGHYREAIPFLEETRNWAADSTELAYTLGTAYIQARQPAKARESFGRMFRVAPDSAAANLVTAQMMIRLEFEEYAESELKQAIEKDPKLPQAHYLLGQIAIYRSRLDEGVALMEKEILLNPGNAMAYYKLGDAYTRQLKWDEAIAPLQKSIWLNPYYSGPYILLGKTYLKKKNYSTAEGMLKRAIQFDPNNKSAHYLLGQIYQQTGRADDAKREFAIAEKLQDNLEKVGQ